MTREEWINKQREIQIKEELKIQNKTERYINLLSNLIENTTKRIYKLNHTLDRKTDIDRDQASYIVKELKIKYPFLDIYYDINRYNLNIYFMWELKLEAGK